MQALGWSEPKHPEQGTPNRSNLTDPSRNAHPSSALQIMVALRCPQAHRRARITLLHMD